MKDEDPSSSQSSTDKSLNKDTNNSVNVSKSNAEDKDARKTEPKRPFITIITKNSEQPLAESTSPSKKINDNKLIANTDKTIANTSDKDQVKKNICKGNSFDPKPIKATIKLKNKIHVHSRQTNEEIKIQEPKVDISTTIEPHKLMPIDYPQSYQPAIIHALFAPNRQVINPQRPLNDFPEPAPRLPDYLKETDRYRHNQAISNLDELNNGWHKADVMISKWDLIQSSALTEHIQLLKAGELAKFPNSFYKNSIKHPLLCSLASIKMIDMADIRTVLNDYPTLKRYGFKKPNISKASKRPNKEETAKLESKNKNITPNQIQHNNPDIQNTDYAEDWEVILYPQRFDETTELSYTDIMACSIAKHALSQCETRKSVNTKLTIQDITDSIRSYQLSQCKELPFMREQLRRTGIYAGHIVIAGILLELEMQINNTSSHTTMNNATMNEHVADINFNISSRCALFTRYPILSSYYINGWK